MPKPDPKWQTLIDEKIKITLVAHVALGGRNLGTISMRRLAELRKATE